MKRGFLYLGAITVALFTVACGSGESTDSNTPSDTTALDVDTMAVAPEDVEEPTGQQLCYLNATPYDTVETDGQTFIFADSMVIKLSIDDGAVTGEYRYLPAEKDKLVGTLEGTQEGDMITANFHWSGEGMTGIEEKIFKLEADKIVEMVGPGAEVDGVWKILDKTELHRGDSVKATDCW